MRHSRLSSDHRLRGALWSSPLRGSTPTEWSSCWLVPRRRPRCPQFDDEQHFVVCYRLLVVIAPRSFTGFESVRESPYATASFDGAGTGGGGAGVRFSDRRRHHERHPSRRFASLRASCGVLAAQTAVVVVILNAIVANCYGISAPALGQQHISSRGNGSVVSLWCSQSLSR